MFFDEDRQRKRNKKLTENFSFIGKISLNLLKKEVLKGLLVSKRLKSGWDQIRLGSNPVGMTIS